MEISNPKVTLPEGLLHDLPDPRSQHITNAFAVIGKTGLANMKTDLSQSWTRLTNCKSFLKANAWIQ